MTERYALDSDGNLTSGSALAFAYSGAGVATLIDKAGTAVKVAVGARNLAGISVAKDGTQALVLADQPVEAPKPAPVVSKSTVRRITAQKQSPTKRR